MGRIVLHIGTHKTGTTSIQRFAAQHRARLLEAGIYYPCYSEIGRPAHYAHLDVAKALMGTPTRLGADGLIAFAAHVRAKAKDHPVTLISAEPFWRGVDAQARPGDRASYWLARKEFIARVAETFPPDETEILAIFRGQADFAESLFQEDVKVNRWRRGMQKFIAHRWSYFQYGAQVDAWASVFPRLTALSFSDLLAEGDLVAALLAHLQGDPSQLPTAERFNESIQSDFVTALRMLNRSDLPKPALRKTRDRLLDLQAAGEVKAWPKRSLWQSAEVRAAFDAGFTSENDRLTAQYGASGAQPIRSRAFSQDVKYGERMSEVALTFLLKTLVNAAPEWTASQKKARSQTQ
ncbi:MAG: hypothetical protein AAGC81_12165 [Pseudomonadota bacterium]